jgi:superfamily II DNA or RNA helicase
MTLPFDRRLALFHWLLDLFEARSFDELAQPLKEARFEGFDADNITHFHHALAARPLRHNRLTKTELLGYDENIVRHWRRITARRNLRGNTLYPKYFQYLALLFTEIYLDRYFRDRDKLLEDLNLFLTNFNRDRDAEDHVSAYRLEDLNKIALWSATGSGKTLLMHVNLLQYQHYLAAFGQARDLNRIILLTPGEGLSEQHRRDFELSDIPAEFFNKNAPASLDAERRVEIIEIHKLQEKAKEKTVAVESFDGNNLVLVDEGHRGTSGEEWMKKRNQLCAGGFSFEYSATFGQAVEAARDEGLTQLYARCILFDYSYKYFYADGYGKDYQILNLTDEAHQRDLYLTGCLLAFYQQKLFFQMRAVEFAPYLIADPLWVFVGGSVNAIRTEGGQQVSDVLSVLLFVAEFLHDERLAVERIEQLLRGRDALLDGDQHHIFAGRFERLAASGRTPAEIYADAVRHIFNAPASGALHVENVKGIDGELALRVGTNDAFGVINVGDSDKLLKLCAERDELVTGETVFGESLFDNLNRPDSCINVLIGSKKFTEGWDSPRVATMGLLNVGRREGSQIIQLFGRGVRLRGYNHTLKRSRYVEERTPPADIELLETLNIYGVRADYMRQFKEYLEREGLPTNDSRVEIIMPVVTNFDKPDFPDLKMIRVKEGVNFKHDRAVSLGAPPAKLSTIALDYYPKIEVRAGADSAAGQAAFVAVKQEAKLEEGHLAFLDFEKLYFDLCAYKQERGWSNFHLSRAAVRDLLANQTWYELLIPEGEMSFADVRGARLWQEIATALLKKYCDYYYKHHREAYEKSFLEIRTLDASDANFAFFNDPESPGGYQLLIEESQRALIRDLEGLKKAITSGQLPQLDWQHNGLKPILFSRHIYQPLFYQHKDAKSGVAVKPVALNESENQFVCDLREYCEGHPDFFADKEMFLLRNMSRGRGIGFFDAGNFHPDFILWLLCDGKQYMTFADPKGLGNLDVGRDPKIHFYRKVKEIERDLKDDELILNSFILSITEFKDVKQGDIRKSIKEFEAANVLFMKDRRTTYIEKMFTAILQQHAVTAPQPGFTEPASF